MIAQRMCFLEKKGVAAAKTVTKAISWFVEKCTLNLEIQDLVAEEMLSESPTGL